MSKTMTLHVCYMYTFWYISFPSSAKQQREMTSLKFFWRTGTHEGEFFFSYWTWAPSLWVQFPDSSKAHWMKMSNIKARNRKWPKWVHAQTFCRGVSGCTTKNCSSNQPLPTPDSTNKSKPGTGAFGSHWQECKSQKFQLLKINLPKKNQCLLVYYNCR